METVSIRADNRITVDGLITGYQVQHNPWATVVKKDPVNVYGCPKDLGDTVSLPLHRYALYSEIPLEGNPGMPEFQEDFLQVWHSIPAGTQ